VAPQFLGRIDFVLELEQLCRQVDAQFTGRGCTLGAALAPPRDICAA
jgi:hypothetical protein